MTRFSFCHAPKLILCHYVLVVKIPSHHACVCVWGGGVGVGGDMWGVCGGVCVCVCACGGGWEGLCGVCLGDVCG